MTHTRFFVTCVTAGLMAGCTYGQTLADYPTSRGPEGATVQVQVPGAGYVGQLLETRADAILILSSARFETRSGNRLQARETVIRLLPYDRVESVQFHRGAKLDGRKWSPAETTSRERFRLLSRFPQGLTPDLLQQLLKMYGQTAPEGGTP